MIHSHDYPSMDDLLGIQRCNWCGGVVSEDVEGAAMKYLGVDDCECLRTECDNCGEWFVGEGIRVNYFRQTDVDPACWDTVCSYVCAWVLTGDESPSERFGGWGDDLG